MKRFLKRHWKRVASILLALAVASLLVFWAKTYDSPAVPKIRYDESAVSAIHTGMTEKEVEALLGGPASSAEPVYELPRGPKYWFADAGIIQVIFDDNGKVIGGATFYTWEIARPRNPLKRFLRYLGILLFIPLA
jgi:hypothetical protein